MFEYKVNQSCCQSSLRAGGCQSWSPQICDGPISLSFPDSGLAFRLCLFLGSLKGGYLYQELIIKLFQCFLLMGGFLAVKGSTLVPDRDLTGLAASSSVP